MAPLFLWKYTFTFLLLTSYKNDHLLQKCILLRYFSSKGEKLYNWLINCGWVTPPVNLCKKLTFQVWNLHVCLPSFDLEESWGQLIQKIKWQGLYHGKFVLYENHAINLFIWILKVERCSRDGDEGIRRGKNKKREEEVMEKKEWLRRQTTDQMKWKYRAICLGKVIGHISHNRHNRRWCNFYRLVYFLA